MKIILAILAIVVLLAVFGYALFFPRSTFITFTTSKGRGITFSRSGVSMEAAPDHYAANGFDHIQPYVSRLLVPTNRFKSIALFTPDGNRGFGLDARDGVVTAGLTVEWRQEPQKEADIREFFKALQIEPSRDYLAGNGGVPDATRVLDYPIKGDADQISALVKRILHELCGLSPGEPLDITYRDK
jgi:hypothetical protein